MAWFTKVSGPAETFESLVDPLLARFRSLGAMLFGALQSKIKGGELGRELFSRVASLSKTGRLFDGSSGGTLDPPTCQGE